MDYCSINGHKTQPLHVDDVQDAAERLASLLTTTDAFRAYMRLARAVRVDEGVGELMAQINDSVYSDDEGLYVEELEERLDALPVVRDYHRSAEEVRAVFRAIDAVIGQAAGLPFAENARACGGG
jgi:cell fate (sporulation/competence/biofilm development) regulator YmcA (YheA/YmcA/DUF963 family)